MKSRGKKKHRSDGDLLGRLIFAQGNLCAGCGLPMLPRSIVKPNEPGRPSIDHMRCRNLGGGNYGNTVAMHRNCNEYKGDDWPTGCELVWLAAVNARMGIRFKLNLAAYRPAK